MSSFCFIQVILFVLILLEGTVTPRKRQRSRPLESFHLLPKFAQLPKLDQTESKNQKLSTSLPLKWLGPKDLSHQLLLSRIHRSKKLDQKQIKDSNQALYETRSLKEDSKPLCKWLPQMNGLWCAFKIRQHAESIQFMLHFVRSIYKQIHTYFNFAKK